MLIKKNSSDGEPCGEVILNAEKLSMRYETGDVIVNALKNVSFQIRRGEFIVVLGPSGSGKSTLLNIVGGMDRPTSGAMWGSTTFYMEPLSARQEAFSERRSDIYWRIRWQIITGCISSCRPSQRLCRPHIC